MKNASYAVMFLCDFMVFLGCVVWLTDITPLFKLIISVLFIVPGRVFKEMTVDELVDETIEGLETGKRWKKE